MHLKAGPDCEGAGGWGPNKNNCRNLAIWSRWPAPKPIDLPKTPNMKTTNTKKTQTLDPKP